MSGWSWDRTDYHVILHQGQVAAYGNGEVRQNDPNVLMRYRSCPQADGRFRASRGQQA